MCKKENTETSRLARRRQIIEQAWREYERKIRERLQKASSKKLNT